MALTKTDLSKIEKLIIKVLKEQIKTLGVLTKNDIKSQGLLTKNDIKPLGILTKDDIKKLGILTKSDIKTLGILTRDDFPAFQELIKQTIDEVLPEKIKAELSHLPTKDEFYKAMDQIMGELEAIRQEQTLLTHDQKDHGERISALEQIHPQGQHPSL